MASYLSRIFSILVKVIQKFVHQLIFWVGTSYINLQSMCILKYFNVIHCRFLSFMYDMFAQCDCNFSMFFILSIGNSSINLLLCTSILAYKIFLMEFFCIIFNSIPCYFWLICNYLTSFCVLWKYNLQWFYNCEKINSVLERILVHFEPDDFWFIRCRQQLCR